MAKGSSFEREICTRLSLWWTNGDDDSCFWRTSMSGGRATVRHRKGKKTRGHAGDICATDGRGRGLVKRIAFELKRGYNRVTITDLIDKPKKAKFQTLEEWIDQAKRSKEMGETQWWAIIHKRDRRDSVIYFPRSLWSAYYHESERLPKPPAYCEIRYKKKGEHPESICCTTLTQFLESIDPRYLKGLQ